MSIIRDIPSVNLFAVYAVLSRIVLSHFRNLTIHATPRSYVTGSEEHSLFLQACSCFRDDERAHLDRTEAGIILSPRIRRATIRPRSRAHVPYGHPRSDGARIGASGRSAFLVHVCLLPEQTTRSCRRPAAENERGAPVATFVHAPVAIRA